MKPSFLIHWRSPLSVSIFCILLSINISIAQSQTGHLKGVIEDKESGETIVGAEVIWIDGDKILKGTISDEQGQFTLMDIAPGDQQILFKYVGYAPVKHTLQILPDRTTELPVNLKPALVELVTVEVIGNASHSLKKLPGAATKVDHKVVEQVQPMGTQELLEQVPGVHGFSDDGMGNSRLSIGIRGLNPRRSSRILVLEDGIPIQPAAYLYPNMYYNPPVERIEAMEVVKGSGSIIYGPQTMGGVINYITKRPRHEFGGTVQLVGGMNQYRSAYVELGGFGNQRLHPEIQLLYKGADGYRDNNDFNQYNATVKLNLAINSKKNLFIKANTNYENTNATYTGLTEYSFANNTNFNPKEHDNFNVSRTSLDLIYTKQINERVIAKTKGYLNYFNRNWWRENDVFVSASAFESDQTAINPVPYYTQGGLVRVGNGATNFGILRQFYVLGAEQTYLVDHSLFGAKANLQVGARAHWEKFIDDRQTGFSPDTRDGHYFVTKGTAAWEEWNALNPLKNTDSISILGQSHHYETKALAAFIQEKIAIRNLEITAGTRFEVFEQERIDRLDGSSYQDKTTMVLLPGIGVNYSLGKLNLYGGIHRGYTPPSSGTLKITNFDANSTASFDLQAEKSWNNELGFRVNNGWLNAEVTGFFIHIDDLVAAGRGTAFTNLGSVQSMGLEQAIQFSWNNLLDKAYLPNLFASYTLMKTQVKSGLIRSALFQGEIVDIAGNELPYAPRHSLTAGINYAFPFGLTLRTDVKYVSQVFSDFENIKTTANRGDQGPIPAYWLLNASVRYSINDNWTVFATGKNLLDKVYIGSRLHSNPGQPTADQSSGILPGARRQINVGVKYGF